MFENITKDELKKLIKKVVRREMKVFEDRVEDLECAVFFAPDGFCDEDDEELDLSELSAEQLDLLIKQAKSQLNKIKSSSNKKQEKSSPAQDPELTNPVFYRFIRPAYIDKQGYIHSNHPKQGSTLRIELDYAKREILVNYSICDGDLFSRDIGRKFADARRSNDDKTIIINMPEKDSPILENFGGIVPYIIDELLSIKRLSDDHELVSDINKILDQYSRQ